MAALPALASAQYFGRNKVQYRTFDFQILKTDHFDLYYYPEEADAAAKRAALETDALAFQIRAETATARDTMAALARVVTDLDSALLPKAAQIEKQLRESYASGLTPLTEVLRARDRRLALERQRLDVLRDYHLARVRHLSAIGQTAFQK